MVHAEWFQNEVLVVLVQWMSSLEGDPW
jgi:hypothetical protein